MLIAHYVVVILMEAAKLKTPSTDMVSQTSIRSTIEAMEHLHLFVFVFFVKPHRLKMTKFLVRNFIKFITPNMITSHTAVSTVE